MRSSFCVYFTVYNLPLERLIHLIPVLSFCAQRKTFVFTTYHYILGKSNFKVNGDQVPLF